MILHVENINDGDTHHTTLNSLRGDDDDYAVKDVDDKKKSEQTKDRRV